MIYKILAIVQLNRLELLVTKFHGDNTAVSRMKK
jgi:hypothetical protein